MLRAAASCAWLAASFALPLNARAEPTFTCATPTHRIEIDAAGGDAFEYRSWRIGQPGAQPALTLRGTMRVEGTGACRARWWSFRNGQYEYLVTDSADCGERAPPADAHGQLTIRFAGEVKAEAWCLGGNNRPAGSAVPNPATVVAGAASSASTSNPPGAPGAPERGASEPAAASVGAVTPEPSAAVTPAAVTPAAATRQAGQPVPVATRQEPGRGAVSATFAVLAILLPIPAGWVAYRSLRRRKGLIAALVLCPLAVVLTLAILGGVSESTATDEHKRWSATERERQALERVQAQIVAGREAKSMPGTNSGPPAEAAPPQPAPARVQNRKRPSLRSLFDTSISQAEREALAHDYVVGSYHFVDRSLVDMPSFSNHTFEPDGTHVSSHCVAYGEVSERKFIDGTRGGWSVREKRYADTGKIYFGIYLNGIDRASLLLDRDDGLQWNFNETRVDMRSGLTSKCD
ncbi:hypothetical protein [Aquabacterium humicola]|uniref:hypothetical protein n=1 Tax=Aquabacterium humicola TaxID=3237377 RepID=UPI002542B505|nr:hypothetical protein [Rubrivivax pictus]